MLAPQMYVLNHLRVLHFIEKILFPTLFLSLVAFKNQNDFDILLVGRTFVNHYCSSSANVFKGASQKLFWQEHLVILSARRKRCHFGNLYQKSVH